ncbi:CDP-glucose 4,6-dehydratase [Rheinheimera hassiensis]|uniref:CDP-glucose 4,6-dehydratase n=1 Tax=Rheinheimera hassiensis TaxID=1193627 RepID=UPI001F0580D1|nr:CDP-glucose 4,6-dehydratase [Rheinheimera hassiensis]
MSLFNGIFNGRKVLLTGHTGFKGSWLAYWLKRLGADVTGVSLQPVTYPNHWQLLNLNINSVEADINNAQMMKSLLQQTKPELVFHLAAQPLVRASYRAPADNWQTNVMGTVNVLEACRSISSVKAIVAVTTDKVYENNNKGVNFSEQDPLGGHDPYSASKAACELVIQSYRRSFFEQQGILLASARAGNVIGGGDWAEDRLIPDIVRASHAGSPLKVRYPEAVRPWQHVLDSLSGYLCLAQGLLLGQSGRAAAWNFGPDTSECATVEVVLRQMQQHWPALNWQAESEPQPNEMSFLMLDSEQAQRQLNWRPVWRFEQSAHYTAQWYRNFYNHKLVITGDQLRQYCQDAKQQGLVWANS